MTREPLVCPSCARPHGGDERFCADCGMPLVYAGDGPVDGDAVSERHARARKIKPQLAEGDLVRVVGARNQTEGEFIQGLLLEEGVPSILRRAAGFDVPDFLAAGPRDVLVPQAGATTAREVLLQAELMPSGVPVGPAPGRLLLGLLIAVALVAVVAWLGTEFI